MRNRIVMLSWEYPPYKIRGLAEHVYELSKALAWKGADVHVVTLGAVPYEKSKGVHVHRIAVDACRPDFITFMNNEMKRIGASIIESAGAAPTIIHAHDWLVGNAAIALAVRYRTPLISTIHSTEFGRVQGIKEGYQIFIHEMEEELVRSSAHIIVCSESMKREVQGLFGMPENISVFPNGVDVSKFDFCADSAAFKERFCGSKDATMIVYIGRLVRQKGVSVLIGALRMLLNTSPELRERVKLVIVGEGPMREHLERDAAYLGVSNHVVFTGYLDDYTVKCLLKAADVVTVPSLYEPFGIVALEAMAAKKPVVVSDVGRLSELICAGEGIKVPSDNSERLANGILQILSAGADDQRKVALARMVEQGFQKVCSLTWNTILEATLEAYKKVLALAPPARPRRWQERGIEIETEKSELWQYSYS
jgi:glycosyltransferase involved in cell wall biosynthesis